MKVANPSYVNIHTVRTHLRHEWKRIEPAMMEGDYGVILIIVDGLSDVGTASLKRRTAMQVANMPTLDALTKRGRTGLQDPVRPGLACGSDTAHLNMFGYDACKVYRGRGAFETIGAGLPMSVGDVAFKCNFATMADDGSSIVRKRCAGSDFAEVAKLLCRDMKDISLPSFPDMSIAVQYAGQHRLVVSFHGPGLSDHISNTDPLSDGRPLLTAVPTKDTTEAKKTARVANAVSDRFREFLKQHPLMKQRRACGKSYSDVVLLRGAAEQISLEPFKMVNLFSTFMIAPTKIISGIGQTAHIDIITAPGATGGYSTNLESKAVSCLKHMSLRRHSPMNNYVYDMGIIHVKAVDEAGHDCEVSKKVHWLEKVDSMVAKILDLLANTEREKMILIVTGDHTTAVEYGDHTCEPVPIIFVDVSADFFQSETMIHADAAEKFDEIDIGTKGSLGRFPGSEIMRMICTLIKGSQKVAM